MLVNTDFQDFSVVQSSLNFIEVIGNAKRVIHREITRQEMPLHRERPPKAGCGGAFV